MENLFGSIKVTQMVILYLEQMERLDIQIKYYLMMKVLL